MYRKGTRSITLFTKGVNVQKELREVQCKFLLSETESERIIWAANQLGISKSALLRQGAEIMFKSAVEKMQQREELDRLIAGGLAR